MNKYYGYLIFLFILIFVMAGFSPLEGGEPYLKGYQHIRTNSRVEKRGKGEKEKAGKNTEENFKNIRENEAEVWSLNSKIIRCYHKSTHQYTYYWACLEYPQLEVRWDAGNRVPLYFLDGKPITANEAKTLAKPGNGLLIGTRMRAGEPLFSLRITNTTPLVTKAESEEAVTETGAGHRNRVLKERARHLKARYRDKYLPDLWRLTSVALTEDSIWVALGSVPKEPRASNRFVLPNGFTEPQHFLESSDRPRQGGILKIDKKTGEYIRFTKENGLPNSLICAPLQAETIGLPHFLPFEGFQQEVVEIRPVSDAHGRIRFITRAQQEAVYDPKLEKWETDLGN